MDMTVLIPAYNEAHRLPGYVLAVREYCARLDLHCESIIIDDGSVDGTSGIVKCRCPSWQELRIVRHDANQGRGQAIRTGTGLARGDLVVYADADGATPIEEERGLRAAIAEGADIAIGSRIAECGGVWRHRAHGRRVIGRSFGLLVQLLIGVPVRDTQCGFKMWRREVGEHVLSFCKDKRWLFDVEFVAWAHRLGYRIAEVPVNWTEVPGSKVHLIRDSWRMFRGLWRIRRELREWERAGRPGRVPQPRGIDLRSVRLSEAVVATVRPDV